MQREQFESRIRDLLPEVTDEAMAAWTMYIEELDHDSVESAADLYAENYVGLSLVEQHHGKDIAAQLFNYGEHFVFNYFELCGAAARLTGGWTLERIVKDALGDGCDATREELAEFVASLRTFQESERELPDMQMI